MPEAAAAAAPEKSAVPPPSEPEPEPAPATAEVPAESEPAPPPRLAPEDVEIVAEPAPTRRVAPVKPASKPKRPGAVGVGVGIAAAVAAVAGVVVFREQVVGLWPGSAAAFAAVGLPTDRLGLVIDDVKSQAVLQGGRPVLSVTGAIRNARGETVTAPSLRVSLLDRDGKPVAAKIARPLNAQIPPGAKRYFAISIPDPPSASASLDIVFEAPATNTAKAPVDAPVEAVLGPEPMEAQPLPETHEPPADHG
ncbi:DUF3426 domain-containing protein [Phenylobacterium sp.]|uniref:DUF3426 domain-containing protein n=1 Tax=Phenylobacterium sp. TaxID=1871053 RepID=UPI002811BE9F|nr:DUF3426 domain-containing protein [Phenylobacterium sp.]